MTKKRTSKKMVTKPTVRKTRSAIIVEKLRPLQRFALYFFERPRFTAVLLLVLAVFGILSYSTLLKREGFPAVNIPYAIGQGVYFVDDPAKVDAELAKPVSDFLLKQDGVKSVTADSKANLSIIAVQYEEGVDAVQRSTQLQDELKTKQIMPTGASLKLEAARFGFTQQGDDAVVSFISTKQPNANPADLAPLADQAAKFLRDKNLEYTSKVTVLEQFDVARNPVTGQSLTVQNGFERYGEKAEDGKTLFYDSVALGITMKQGSDVLKFNDELQSAIDEYNSENKSEGTALRLSASYAPSIRQQISELQRTLIEGLLAVLVIGSIVIAVRASFITVLSMATVILATLGLLYLMGYTLNTITLFALILGLSLIVDDTIIMVEALDVQRRRLTNRREIVSIAVGKVGKAMIAATTTAALSFAPLLFVGGVLGSFIRAIPVTIISALLISLVVALVFIPLYARFILFGRGHVGKSAEREMAAGFEQKVAEFVGRPMLWARSKPRRLAAVIGGAVVIALSFVIASGFLFQKITFNIFPPGKDTNQITMTLDFPSGTSITEAESASDAALKQFSSIVGEDFVHGANYGFANAQQMVYYVDLVDYNERETTAPEYVAELKKAFADFPSAQAGFATVDAGPPAASFVANIEADTNREGAIRLANDIVAYLKTADIRRLDDSRVRIESVAVNNTDSYSRNDGQAKVGLKANFADTDTSTLVILTQQAVEKEFPASRVAGYGLNKDALTFSFGQEDENQDSFKTLAIAFPLVLVVIYLVLVLEFRSLLQPLLIFMAIPFSLFGVTMGLWLTDNPFSFFAMLGFFALIGLSIKNTILLTDYANQARRAGRHPIDAAHDALAERFRPLIATSLTAIVSLIPLALTSPFWQGLAVVLMFGLLSSTFLVVTVFPYFYLGGEFARDWWGRHIGARLRRLVTK